MTTSSQKVLVVAAHPDDEVLGCGATIAIHSERGDQVSVLIMAEGATSRLSKRERSVVMMELTELNSAAQVANSILGVKRLNLLDFPDNRMDSVDLLDVIKVIETEINEWQPDIVYTHHVGDVNIDHRVIHDAVIAATRPLPGRKLQTVLFLRLHQVRNGALRHLLIPSHPIGSSTLHHTGRKKVGARDICFRNARLSTPSIT